MAALPASPPGVPVPHTDPHRWRALVEAFKRAHPADTPRIERGWRIVAQRDLRATAEPGTYLVPGSAPGTLYRTRALACTCPDAPQRGARCKHQWAVALLRAAIAEEAGRLVDRLNAALRLGELSPDAAQAQLTAFYAQFAPVAAVEEEEPWSPAR